jgi:hypothetical protein
MLDSRVEAVFQVVTEGFARGRSNRKMLVAGQMDELYEPTRRHLKIILTHACCVHKIRWDLAGVPRNLISDVVREK